MHLVGRFKALQEPTSVAAGLEDSTRPTENKQPDRANSHRYNATYNELRAVLPVRTRLKMKSRKVWVGIGALLMVIVIVAVVVMFLSDNGKLPRAARQVIQKRYPDATVIDTKQRTAGGKTEYHVALLSNGRRADVSVTAEGQFTRAVRDVAPSDLPKIVSNALAAKYPNSDVRSVEEISKSEGGTDTIAQYEVLLVTGGKREIEIQVSPDGKIKSK